jgi:hypothetical protein
MILFKKQLFDLEIKGQGPTKFITVRDTPPSGHAPTYKISLTYLERQKCYGPDKKILFKKQLFDLEVKGQGSMKVITVCDTPPGAALAPKMLVPEKSPGIKFCRQFQKVGARKFRCHNFFVQNHSLSSMQMVSLMTPALKS